MYVYSNVQKIALKLFNGLGEKIIIAISICGV